MCWTTPSLPPSHTSRLDDSILFLSPAPPHSGGCATNILVTVATSTSWSLTTTAGITNTGGNGAHTPRPPRSSQSGASSSSPLLWAGSIACFEGLFTSCQSLRTAPCPAPLGVHGVLLVAVITNKRFGQKPYGLD